MNPNVELNAKLNVKPTVKPIVKSLAKCLLLSLFLTSSAYAETLVGGYPACLTEDLLGEYIRAERKGDTQGMLYLLNNGCIITATGIRASIIKTTWSGKVKVRAYNGNRSMVLWTIANNVRRKDDKF